MSAVERLVRAAGVTEFGGPDSLHVVEVPESVMRPKGVRIRVEAAAVSPTDTLLRAGLHAHRDPVKDGPFVPGMDVAGTVVGWGAEVEGFATGDRVMGIVMPTGAHGGYREEIVLPAASVARIPAGSTIVEASTLPMNGLTARLTLDQLALAPGQVVAVTGAAGTFGGYVVQLAKADGLVVVADAAEADEELVRSLGADVVVRRGPDVASAIRAEFPGGVDGLADGSVQDAQVLPAVRDGGRMTSVRGYRGDDGDVEVTATLVRDYARNTAALGALAAQVEAGVLTLRVAGTFSMAEAAQAHRLLEAGGVRGRSVLTF